MSLLKIDTEALQREVQTIFRMFKERGPALAERLGFVKTENGWKKGTAIIYAFENVDGWTTAQFGKVTLVAHVHHDTCEEALVDALNRDC